MAVERRDETVVVGLREVGARGVAAVVVDEAERRAQPEGALELARQRRAECRDRAPGERAPRVALGEDAVEAAVQRAAELVVVEELPVAERAAARECPQAQR